jgi:hypothetical protein
MCEYGKFAEVEDMSDKGYLDDFGVAVCDLVDGYSWQLTISQMQEVFSRVMMAHAVRQLPAVDIKP